MSDWSFKWCNVVITAINFVVAFVYWIVSAKIVADEKLSFLGDVNKWKFSARGMEIL